MPQAAIPWIVGIGTAAKVGTDIYSAKKASDASKEAAQAQTAAGNQSLALQRDVWQQSQQNLQPWMQRGSQAVNTMAELMGFGPAPTAAGGATPPATTGPSPILGTRGYAWQQRTPENETTFGRDPNMPGQGNWASQRAATIRERRLAEVLGAALPQNQSGYVQMRAPDGTVQPVPTQYVDHYTQLGAQIVG